MTTTYSAADLIRLEEAYGAHNYHPLDLVISRARGVWVWDVEGKKYLDFLAAYSAVDRGNEQVAALYRPFHPAVLHLLRRVVEAAGAARIPVSLCGEMAGDPLAVPVLVGLGIQELSMHPAALPVVRGLIRALQYREARRIAQRALQLASAKAVEEFLLEQLSGLLSHLKVRIQP